MLLYVYNQEMRLSVSTPRLDPVVLKSTQRRFSLNLHHDMLTFTVMGEARFAWHGVPKIFPDTCPSHLASWPDVAGLDKSSSQWHGWMKNKRINLNVRQMH